MLLVILAALYWGWDWAHGKDASNGETLRNLALACGASLAALIGLPLAIWRSCTAHKQAEAANKQAETSERGLRNERYQKAAEMLGSGTLTTRMGGIYALERLAQDHPKDYHAQIMNLLCAFARYRTEPEAASAADKTGEAEASKRSEQKCPPDVAAAVKAVGKCRKRLRDKDTLEKIEKGTSEKSDREPDWTLNLTRVNLTGADLTGADLTGADLEDTILVWVDLKGANLKGAILVGVDLKGADLEGADLEGVDLTGADLEGADLTGAIGLTQEMLLSAQPSSPPKSLPDGLSWPFEEGTDGKWRPKP